MAVAETLKNAARWRMKITKENSNKMPLALSVESVSRSSSFDHETVFSACQKSIKPAGATPCPLRMIRQKQARLANVDGRGLRIAGDGDDMAGSG